MRGMLKLEQLRELVGKGDIETVVAGFTDHYGRLMGKRFDAEMFVEDIAKHGGHACDYLLTVDMEMDPVPGYRFANWELGYGDFHLVPDLATLRVASWLEKSALVLCDVQSEKTHDYVAVAPRSILRRQVDSTREKGYQAFAATELEHYLVHTASALFSLGVLVLGGEAGQLPVRDAGLAYGLARIIQALPAHASRGQMYLPLDELAHAGVAPEDVFAGKSSAGLQRLLQELAGRARTHLQNSFGQMVRSQVSAQALLPLALVDRRLRRIMSAGYKPFDPPRQSSNLGVLWALWRASRSKPFL